MFSKKTVADSLFGIQLIFALVFGVSQFLHTVQTGEQVASITWFILWQLFLFINLTLSYQAHRVQPSRVTLQTFWGYLIMTVMVAIDLVASLILTPVFWNHLETFSVAVVSLGVAITLWIAKRKNLRIRDPLVRGWLAVLFKGVPQLILTCQIILVGGEGIALLVIIAGHAMILTRLGQLWFSIREAGWDRNRVGSAISEVANESSWILVTIAWLLF